MKVDRNRSVVGQIRMVAEAHDRLATEAGPNCGPRSSFPGGLGHVGQARRILVAFVGLEEGKWGEAYIYVSKRPKLKE